MPYHKGEIDYLAPGEDSEAMVELKEMQRTLSWQKYHLCYLPFLLSLILHISPSTAKVTPSITGSATVLVVEGKKEVTKFFQFLLELQAKLDEADKKEREKNEGTPGKKNIKILGGKSSKTTNAAPPTRRMLNDVPVLYPLSHTYMNPFDNEDMPIRRS